MSVGVIARLLALLGGLSLLGGVGCAAPPRTAGPVPAGPALVVVAPDRPTRTELGSEAYADWAATLDDYSAAKPARLRIVRVSAERWRRLFVRPAMPARYAAVFLRADGQALVRSGRVLDPPIYEAGGAWALGGARPDVARMGMTPAVVARRR